MNENQMDWQQGNESKLTSIDRLIQHQEWLKKQHQDIKNKIYLKEKGDDKPPTGFIKD